MKRRQPGRAIRVRRIWTTEQARTARLIAVSRMEGMVWYHEQGRRRDAGLETESVTPEELNRRAQEIIDKRSAQQSQ